MLANEMKYDFLILYDKIANLAAPGYDDREVSYILNKAQDRVFFHLYNPLGNKYQQGFEFNEKRRRDLAELVKHVIILPDNTTGSQNYVYTRDSADATILTLAGNVDYRGLCEGLLISGSDITGGSATIVHIISSDLIRISTSTTVALGGTGVFSSGLGLSESQAGIHTLTSTEIKGYMVDLPSLFLYPVEEAVKTSEAPDIYISVKPITHDYIRANVRNPYTKPWKNKIWRMDIGRNIHGLGDEDNTVEGGITQYSSTYKRVELITNGSTVSEYYLRYLSYPRRIIVDEVSPELQVSCELDESIHNLILDEAVKVATGITDPQSYQIKTAESVQSE